MVTLAHFWTIVVHSIIAGLANILGGPTQKALPFSILFSEIMDGCRVAQVMTTLAHFWTIVVHSIIAGVANISGGPTHAESSPLSMSNYLCVFFLNPQNFAPWDISAIIFFSHFLCGVFFPR
jgi:hypothetical protein